MFRGNLLTLLLASLFMIGLSSMAQAQTPFQFYQKYSLYNTQNGLLSDECYWVHSDQAGQIWVASDNGLVRFDGRTFHPYQQIASVSAPVILGGHETPDGQLYFFNYRGRIYQYRHLEDEFNELPISDTLAKITSGTVITELHVEADTFFVTTKMMFVKIYPVNGSYRYEVSHSIRNNTYRINLLEDPKDLEPYLRGIRSKSAITEFTGRDRSHITPPGWRQKGILCTAETKNDWWIFYPDILLLINKKTQKIRFKNLPFEPTMGFHKKGNVLFIGSTKRGLWKLKLTNSDTLQYNQLIKNEHITGVCIDRQNGIWASSHNSGLFHIPRDEVFESPLKQNDVFYSFQLENHLILFTRHPSTYLYKVTANGLQFDHISRGHGVVRKVYPLNHSYFIGETVGNYRLFSFIEGTLKTIGHEPWMSGHFWRLKNGKPEFYFSDSLNLHAAKIPALGHKVVARAKEFNKDGLYVATNFSRFDYVQRSDSTVIDLVRRNGFENLDVRGLERFGKDSLLLITKRNGILLFHGLNMIRKLNLNRHLVNEALYGIDRQGNRLLIAAATGLYMIKDFTSPNPEISNISEKLGLPQMRVNRVWQNRDIVVFVTDKFVYHFPPSLLDESEITYPLQVNTAGSNLLDRLINNPEPGLNSLALSVNAYNLVQGPRTEYRYRLYQSKPTAWTTTRSPDLNFQSLAPGTYHLEIQTHNSSGNWEEKGAIHEVFTIPPPFWKTFSFIFLMIGLGGALMSGLVYLFYRRKRNLSNLKTSLMQLEFHSLGTQLNPHFVNNALNSASAQIAKNDLKTGLIYLSDFGKLMRTIFNNSAVSILPLEEEIDAIRQYLNMEKIRLKEKIDYHIEIDPEVDTYEHRVPSLLLQPLVENAIWHGILPTNRPGVLWIKVYPSDNGIVIDIIDNGVGFNRPHKKPPFSQSSSKKNKNRHSLQVVRQRLLLMEKIHKIKSSFEIREAEPGSSNPGTHLSIYLSEIAVYPLT